MKKLVLIILSLILVVLLGIVIYINFFKEQKIAVLTYHGVVDKVENVDGVDISVNYFEKQMKWLADNNYNTITMDEFYKWKKGDLKLPRKSVLITFDDGWKNNYVNAFPILKKYNLKASVFVVWKYSENSNNAINNIYINDKDIKNIEKDYKMIELLSHSYNLHYFKNAKSNNYIIYSDDVQKVKSLNRNVEYYAYPFGYRNERYIKALKDNGTKLAFTFGPYAFASKNDNDYEIPRMGVFENTSFMS